MENNFKEKYEQVLKRFLHLMESEYISSFDEWDRNKQDYKRNIADADIEMRNKTKRIIILQDERMVQKQNYNNMRNLLLTGILSALNVGIAIGFVVWYLI